MSLIVLGSASGSPGVSTTALGLALGWPRPVLLVEADPTGASAVASGYLRGQVEPPNAMTDLVNAHFDDRLRETLAQVSIDLPQSQCGVPGPSLTTRPAACWRCGTRCSRCCGRWRRPGRT